MRSIEENYYKSNKRTDVSKINVDSNSSVTFFIDDLIAFLAESKANGATHIELSSFGYDAELEDIETFYLTPKTQEEIEKENEHRLNAIRTIKFNYVPPTFTNNGL